MIPAFLIALGVVRGLDWVKEALPQVPPRWMRSGVAIGACFGLAFWLTDDPWLVALGASGMAMMLHEIHAWLVADGTARAIVAMSSVQRRGR